MSNTGPRSLEKGEHRCAASTPGVSLIHFSTLRNHSMVVFFVLNINLDALSWKHVTNITLCIQSFDLMLLLFAKQRSWARFSERNVLVQQHARYYKPGNPQKFAPQLSHIPRSLAVLPQARHSSFRARRQRPGAFATPREYCRSRNVSLKPNQGNRAPDEHARAGYAQCWYNRSNPRTILSLRCWQQSTKFFIYSDGLPALRWMRLTICSTAGMQSWEFGGYRLKECVEWKFKMRFFFKIRNSGTNLSLLCWQLFTKFIFLCYGGVTTL